MGSGLLAILLSAALAGCGTGLCPFFGCTAYDGLNLSDHRIFLTSTTHNGNLGGLSGADAICQARASAAGLGRSYKAILSDSTANAAARLSFSGSVYIFTAADTSEKVVENGSDLWDTNTNNLLRSITISENFASIGPVSWTGSNVAGIATANHCDNWSSADNGDDGQFGQTSNLGAAYLIAGVGAPCNSSFRLYCISQ